MTQETYFILSLIAIIIGMIFALRKNKKKFNQTEETLSRMVDASIEQMSLHQMELDKVEKELIESHKVNVALQEAGRKNRSMTNEDQRINVLETVKTWYTDGSFPDTLQDEDGWDLEEICDAWIEAINEQKRKDSIVNNNK